VTLCCTRNKKADASRLFHYSFRSEAYFFIASAAGAEAGAIAAAGAEAGAIASAGFIASAAGAGAAVSAAFSPQAVKVRANKAATRAERFIFISPVVYTTKFLPDSETDPKLKSCHFT